jgi:molybdopterin converting factor small subunit
MEAGLSLHTIVYATGDAGVSWRAANRGIRVVSMHPARPERLFLQNHWGLYRSDDGAESWQDIARGVPSDFGFAMVMHPRDPDCVYILPVESDEFRCTPDGRLRDAMTADSLDPSGIYFGGRSGILYGSVEKGKTWKKILDGRLLCDALEVLWALYPGIRDRMVTEQGQIPEHINLFVGNENVRYSGALATPLPDSADISIVPAISGGLSLDQIRSISKWLRDRLWHSG